MNPTVEASAMKPAVIAAAQGTGAFALLGLAALHLAWATGSPWPARDRLALANAVIGSDSLPGAGPSVAVATLLVLASALVSGWPESRSRVQRTGAAGVAFVLLARAAAGFAGRLPQERSPIFKRWNRRLYSPLCAALGALAAAGTYPSR